MSPEANRTMNVGDLIEELQKLDPALPVAVLNMVNHDEIGWVDLHTVTVDEAHGYLRTAFFSTPVQEYVGCVATDNGHECPCRPDLYSPMQPVVKLEPRDD